MSYLKNLKGKGTPPPLGPVRKMCRKMWPCLTFKGFLRWLSGKESACQCRSLRKPGLIPGSRRSSGGGNDSSLQYFCLENPMDRGVWWATVHGITKSWTWLSTHALQHLKEERTQILKIVMHYICMFHAKLSFSEQHLKTSSIFLVLFTWKA